MKKSTEETLHDILSLLYMIIIIIINNNIIMIIISIIIIIIIKVSIMIYCMVR